MKMGERGGNLEPWAQPKLPTTLIVPIVHFMSQSDCSRNHMTFRRIKVVMRFQ